jgi:hypothetical protein
MFGILFLVDWRRSLWQGSGVDRMLDLLFLLIVIGFFGSAWAFVRGCDRL